jgi:hypothetical protein
MNEQILKLSDRALKECDAASERGIEQYSKRFAELIVQECVTIINHGIDYTEYPHSNDVEKSMIEMKVQMWCRDAIKEHFGVGR